MRAYHTKWSEFKALTEDAKIPTGSIAVYKNLNEHLEHGDDLIPISKNDSKSLFDELNLQLCTSIALSKSPPKINGNDLE